MAAQDLTGKDSTTLVKKDTFFLAKKKGWLGKIGKSLSVLPEDTVVKNNDLFEIFGGAVIRKIIINHIPFGKSLNDSSKTLDNFLTRFASKLHHNTKNKIVRNNLFFKEGDKVFPYLLADNERHLREQLYLQDAKIIIEPANDDATEVDVYVDTKDIFSLGGNINLINAKSGELSISEENLMGNGDYLGLQTFYDGDRRNSFGYGAEYKRRNIKGTFTDWNIGFRNFAPAFNSFRNEETVVYSSLTKPLVSPYFPLTFTLSAEHRSTMNMYIDDSTYKRNFRYQYYTLDAWAAYNIGSSKKNINQLANRRRTFIALRGFKQNFTTIPRRYEDFFFYQYANVAGVLGSISILKQDFYKGRYIYGFGRNEDIPEGYNASVIAGYTNKEQRDRMYVGVDFDKSYFSGRGNYFKYGFKFGSYIHDRNLEDITWLLSFDYFSKLRTLNSKWKQRTFINASFTKLNNIVLYEPLYLSSNYGLSEFTNTGIGAEFRATIKGEMVFFNRLFIAGFKFAPFVFMNTCFLTPRRRDFSKTDGYSSIGAGIRSRNESLVFGTMELRAFYFPRKNVDMTDFKIEFTTGLRFKYNSQIVKRPEFVVVN